ncbi:MAG: ATPase, partial [Lachnospiraceae bacterium]|nr:ATPase [Lachnospiraceae bacterium]
MIVKMKFLNIRGPQDDIDRVCDVYLSKYEMQLENAITELRTTDSLLPFVDVNPYKDLLNKAEQFVALITDDKAIMDVEPKSLDEITTLIRDVNHDYMTLNEQKEVQKKAKDEVQGKINTIEPFRSLDFDFHKVMNYKFMEVRFGRISVDNYDKLWKYLMDDLYGIFFEGTRTESYVYGCYFVANEDARKVDGIFNSLKFERIDINDEYAGTPEEALAALNLSLEEIAEKIDKYDKDIEDVINNHAAALKSARRRLSALSTNFDVRKLAARVETDGNQEYILVGWMTESDTEGFLSDVKDDKRVTVTVEDSRET